VDEFTPSPEAREALIRTINAEMSADREGFGSCNFPRDLAETIAAGWVPRDEFARHVADVLATSLSAIIDSALFGDDDWSYESVLAAVEERTLAALSADQPRPGYISLYKPDGSIKSADEIRAEAAVLSVDAPAETPKLNGNRDVSRLGCWLCGAPAVYRVTDTTDGEELDTCSEHMTVAFS